MTDHTRLSVAFGRYRIRSGEGEGIVGMLSTPVKGVLEGTVYLFAIEGVFNVSLPLLVLPLIVLSKLIAVYGIGLWRERIDHKQVEAGLQSMLNTYNQKMLHKVNEILKEVKKENEKWYE